MAKNNNWYTHYSTFEEDRGAIVPIVAQGRDARFFDSSQKVYSRAVGLGALPPLPPLQVTGWGEDRWPDGREVKNHILRTSPAMHFVVGGKGTLNELPLEAGTAFLTKPGIPYSMTADEKEPLHYFWVRVQVDFAFLENLELFTFGTDGCGRMNFSPCLDEVKQLFRKGLSMSGDGITMQLGITGLFLEVLSRCLQHSARTEKISPYVARSLEYIRTHYGEPLNVNRLAELQYISRNHLRRLFLRDLGRTPKDQITLCRMEMAANLLDAGEAFPSLSEIAAAVGYPSYSQFVQAFRKTFGCTPKEYKKRTQ